MTKLNLYMKGVAAAAGIALAGPTFADPPITQNPPPPVFCWSPTAAGHEGGGIALQFEVLNWTDEDAKDLHLDYSQGLSTDGFGFGDAGVAPGPFPGKVNTNDWSVDLSTQLNAAWVAGTALPSIDVDLNNDGNYSDHDPYPFPIDSGNNALDGFQIDLPGLGVGERVVFDWWLSDAAGNQIGQDNGGFSHGVGQIDRAHDAPNGQIRLAIFFWKGLTTQQIGTTDIPPVDLALTDDNAQTVSSIPVPAAAWLFGSGLAAVFGISRRKQRPDIDG